MQKRSSQHDLPIRYRSQFVKINRSQFVKINRSQFVKNQSVSVRQKSIGLSSSKSIRFQAIDSIVVSIPACQGGDQGSIPCRGVTFHVSVKINRSQFVKINRSQFVKNNRSQFVKVRQGFLNYLSQKWSI